MGKAKEWAEKVEALMLEAKADGVNFDYIEEDSYASCPCQTAPRNLTAIVGPRYLPKSFKYNPNYEEVEVYLP